VIGNDESVSDSSETGDPVGDPDDKPDESFWWLCGGCPGVPKGEVGFEPIPRVLDVGEAD